MTVAEIKNHRTFRPIRELILKIVDNQIDRYKKIGNGEIAGESESDEDPDTDLDFEEVSRMTLSTLFLITKKRKTKRKNLRM